MQRIYKIVFIINTLILAGQFAFAQNPVSVDPELEGIFTQRVPKEYTIAGITVVGSKAFDANLIVSISGLAVGDKITIPGTDVFGKAISKLWRQSLISDIEIYLTKLEGTNLFIEFNITERPRLASLKFEGIKKGEKDDLEPKLALVKDRVLTENMKLSAIEAIRKFYYGKAYRNVDIQLKEEPVTSMNNAVALTFIIKKGSKVKVNSINFSGNENIAASKLKKQMKGTKEMNRITLFPIEIKNPFGDTISKPSFKEYINDVGFMSVTKTRDYIDPYFRIRGFSGAKFNEVKYIEDKESVLNYYNSRGYRDAVIVKDTSILDEKNNLNLFVKVNEGRQYYFGNIVWRGNTKYADSILNTLLGIQKGDVYNLDILNKRLGKQLSAEGADIGSLYMDDGYLFFQVDPVETAVYNDTIDFELRMREGPQAVYGNITISGNKKTKDYVIRRELRTIPGEKFSRQDIIRTQRELGQLGFIDPEKINPGVVPNAENGTVDINWGIEEKSGDQLELSAGFGGGIGLTGTLGVSFNNFSLKNITKRSTWDPLPSGDGQKLSARIQSNGKAFRSYNFSFTEPWLGGKKRNSFTVGYSNTKYANAYDASTGSYCKSCGDTSYVKTASFNISLGKQLKWPDDYFNLIYSLNVQRYKLRNYDNIFQGIRNGTSTNISLKVALVRNSAGPNPIFPTSGSNFLLSGQFTLPYSLLGISSVNTNNYKLPEFHKWRLNSEWYVPIGTAKGPDKNKQFILKIAAKYGFIGRYNNKLDISPFERFQLGDAGLSNNFALLGYDIIAHRGYPVYDKSDPRINPDGITPSQFFTIFNKYTMELRYPFSTSASSTIYGLAFFEAANGWYSFKDYDPFKLRRSAGVGLRFFLPMFGLLGFDYGIGLDRYNNSSGLKGAAKFTFMLGQEPE